MTLALPLLASCGAPAADDRPWIVDRFDDIKVIRYEVPGFENLPLEQKELVYTCPRRPSAAATSSTTRTVR